MSINIGLIRYFILDWLKRRRILEQRSEKTLWRILEQRNEKILLLRSEKTLLLLESVSYIRSEKTLLLLELTDLLQEYY